MPPCFSAASEGLNAASNDNMAAASVRTLRMVLSLGIPASWWAVDAKGIPWQGVQATATIEGRHWHFGLIGSLGAAVRHLGRHLSKRPAGVAAPSNLPGVFDLRQYANARIIEVIGSA
jgi:hypothetical protein